MSAGTAGAFDRRIHAARGSGRAHGVVAVRRLVVTGAHDQLVGILTLDGVLDHLIKEAGSVGRLLERQQAHVVA